MSRNARSQQSPVNPAQLNDLGTLRLLGSAYNDIVQLVHRTLRRQFAIDPDIELVRRWSTHRSDISTHLEALYTLTLSASPAVIVELGVRGGVSSRVLALAAERADAHLVSCDIKPCDPKHQYPKTIFVASDDVEFGCNYKSWANEHHIPETIDVLFIDTSHEFEHTTREIDAWFPHLSEDARVIFHDTNMNGLFLRHDMTIGIGWDNQRGVIRAIEEFLGTHLYERRSFAAHVGRWLVRHDARCNGLTLLRRE